MRDFISSAALLVKVKQSISSGLIPALSALKTRSAITVVFPVPTGAKPKSLGLSEGDSRVYQYENAQ